MNSKLILILSCVVYISCFQPKPTEAVFGKIRSFNLTHKVLDHIPPHILDRYHKLNVSFEEKWSPKTIANQFFDALDERSINLEGGLARYGTFFAPITVGGQPFNVIIDTGKNLIKKKSPNQIFLRKT